MHRVPTGYGSAVRQVLVTRKRRNPRIQEVDFGRRRSHASSDPSSFLLRQERFYGGLMSGLTRRLPEGWPIPITLLRLGPPGEANSDPHPPVPLPCVCYNYFSNIKCSGGIARALPPFSMRHAAPSSGRCVQIFNREMAHRHDLSKLQHSFNAAFRFRLQKWPAVQVFHHPRFAPVHFPCCCVSSLPPRALVMPG